MHVFTVFQCPLILTTFSGVDHHEVARFYFFVRKPIGVVRINRHAILLESGLN